MTLEEEEKAPLVLGESVDTRDHRSGEYFIAAASKRAFRQVVVPRMGNTERFAQALRDRMGSNHFALEDAELLIWKSMAFDAVRVENGCMGCQTRPDRGNRILP